MNTTACTNCGDAEVVGYCDNCDAPCCADHGYNMEIAGLGESFGCDDCVG